MDVRPTLMPLSSLPIDIATKIFKWIPEKSVDACLLRQTSKSMKQILTQHLGWRPLIDPHIPLTHDLKVNLHRLPKPSRNDIEILEAKALRHGQFENFICLHGDEKILPRHVGLPVKHGHLECIKRLLNLCDGDSLKAAYDEVLLEAAFYGHIHIFAHVVTLLHWERINNKAVVQACKTGHLEMVKYLHFTVRLDVHTEKELPLLFASGCGFLDIVQFLVSLGCVIRSEDDRAFKRAAQYGHLEVVKFLYSASRGTPVRNINEAIVMAASGGHLDVLTYLQSLTATSAPTLNRALIGVTQNGHDGCLGVVKFLHSIGANIHINDDIALKTASLRGWLEIVEFLCAVRANVDAEDGEVIRLAIKHGHLAILKVLHSYGADVHYSYDTPLQLASEYGHLLIVKFLYANGADIHARRDLALRRAAANGHIKVVQFLHSVGANIHACDNDPLQEASTNGRLAVVKYLHSAGADIHYNYEQPLRLACRNDQLEVAMFLFSVGANVQLALQYAKKDVLSYKTLATFIESLSDETANIDSNV